MQTSQVTIPPDVLARYNSVNQTAETAASKPFQVYSQDPAAFVAPLTSTQQAGISNTNSAAGQAQPFFDAATGQLTYAQHAAQPYLDAATQGVLGAQGSGGLGGAYASLAAANQNAAPLNSSAGNYYSSAFQAAQPYNQGAGQLIGAGLGAAQPLNAQAASGLSGAYQGAQPYNQSATGLAVAGSQGVNPSDLSSASINKYLSPYLGTVLQGTAGLLDQQNQMQQSGQMGDAIKQGWFGGDRSGIAAANLAQQQSLANSKIYSDILNQGYGQALGAAQQQQGVGLSAAQANRAALSGAAGQLAQIGQQQYGQGTGTAEAQAALGQQLYGQGLGASGALQGLGQQVYGQGTGTGSAVQGLGQQVFGQGLATSQQQQSIAGQDFQQQLAAAQALAGLGGQQYSMGSNTAQQLAGLGSGAQAASLQGAQAQLSAGQQQQQTQQAGLQALYNQFLQQQSYPFQTAQFLANIAEGTGSLSGSTTTTTQPGGFFSDKRLKEDLKEVGRTFDGQPIVTYRYKDEPNVVRLGLIAQEVEKKHPGAVGESHGFKTVDYGRATEKAAERGHFAAGGPTLPGLSPSDMSELLQARQAMYAPYGQGLYGAEASSAPRGGSSYVPQANLPVSHLTVAAPTAPPPSALEQMKTIADLGNDLEEGFGKAKGYWDKAHKDQGPTALATGGVAPYGEGLDIPDDASRYSLQTAHGASGAPKSGLSDVKDAASTALAVAKLAAMFSRGGFAEGGDPDLRADESGDNLSGGAGNDRVVDSKPAWPFGRMEHVTSQKEPEWNPWGPGRPPHVDLTQPVVRAGLGTIPLVGPAATAAYDAAQNAALLAKARPPSGASATWDAPTVRPVSKGLAPHQAPHEARPTPQPPPPQPAGLGAAAPVDAPASVSPVVAAPPPAEATGLQPTPNPQITPDKGPGIMDRIGKSPIGDYFAGLKHGDVNNWVSLLSALGAAGTAPTVHPGVALAAGLGAGAKAYMGSKKTQAELAQRAATTQQTEAAAATANAPSPPEGYAVAPGPSPDGKFILGKDGKTKWHFEMNVNATNFGAPAPATVAPPKGIAVPSASTDAFVRDQFKVEPGSPGVANHARAVALNPEVAALDKEAHDKIQERIGNLQDAENSRRQTVQSAQAYASLPKTGLMSQGHASERRALWANVLTTAENMMGIPSDPAITSATAENQIINKIRQLSGPQIASTYGEKAASVAHAISGVIPSGDTSPKAAAEIMSALLVQSQMLPELAQYKDQYASRYGLMAGVEPAFQRDMQSRYAADQQALSKFLNTPGFNRAVTDLQSSDPKVRERAINTVDGVYNAPISRYFTGPQ